MPEAVHQLLPARRRAVRGRALQPHFLRDDKQQWRSREGTEEEQSNLLSLFVHWVVNCQSHMRVFHLWLLSLEAPAWGRHLIAGWKMKSWMIDISHERAVGTPTAEIGASRGSRMIRRFLKEGVQLPPCNQNHQSLHHDFNYCRCLHVH